MAYATIQSVQEEAGLWQRELAGTPAGLVNGSNTVFVVDHKPLADNNYSDDITTADVTAYVNDAPVTVTAVNATTGAITLAAAPASLAVVTIDYSYSSVASSYATEAIEEASEWVVDSLSEVLTIAPAAVPKQVRMLTRLYAAGLLMIRFFGLQNSEDQVDSGYAKLKLAKSLMKDYRATIVMNGETVGTTNVPVVTAKKSLFQRYDESEGRWDKPTDENFTVNRVL